MIDTLLANIDRLLPPIFCKEAGLSDGNYFALTLHRPANVDCSEDFRKLFPAISDGTRGLPVVFPVHPRTARTLKGLGDLPGNLLLVDSQGYLEFNYLVRHAKAVITDSGDITEETTVMGVPCMTLRDNTERPETISIGTDPAALVLALERFFAGNWKRGDIPEKWDGKAGERIVAQLESLLPG